MSGLKTLACLACLAGTMSPAAESASNPQLEFFATCAGRYSALMEFQWTHDTAKADDTARKRAAMLDLVAAVMPPEHGRQTLVVRVNAKAAYAHLLRRALRDRDPTDARWAARRAAQMMTDCSAMLL